MILSIETATPVCSVALHIAGNLVANYELHTERSHSDQLTSMIEQICKQSGVRLSDISAVAISKGPGSYTGLRIGVATAKGLCFALDKPLIAINTLEAMVWQINAFFGENTLFCPMIDARRMEVYCLVADSKGNILEGTQAKIIDNQSFENILSTNKVVFFGNGATKCKSMIEHENAIFLEGVYPTAKTVGLLASQKYPQNIFEDLIYFEPFYLKDFVGKKVTNLL
ncbi:tRNA threonylcarbamoyladenosine biosynthesis protein TsaB [bacterium 336/3]|nr:tRNA threonylcarbamoyladenosine biosynthesis protein TsaB [bacterium 336/3]